MDLQAYEAAGLFVLWVVQFVFPSLRVPMMYVYGAWIAIKWYWCSRGASR